MTALVEQLQALVKRWTEQAAHAASNGGADDVHAGIGRAECADQLLDVLIAHSVEQRELQEWAIDVVFDGPPGPEAGRFVEVEDVSGKSVGVGQWIDRGNGMWALRIPRVHPAQREADLCEAWIAAVQWAFERPASEAEIARAAEYARGKAGRS